MGLKQTIIKGGNTLGTFAQTIQDKSLILVYGTEEEVLDVDFANAVTNYREVALKNLFNFYKFKSYYFLIIYFSY